MDLKCYTSCKTWIQVIKLILWRLSSIILVWFTFSRVVSPGILNFQIIRFRIDENIAQLLLIMLRYSKHSTYYAVSQFTMLIRNNKTLLIALSNFKEWNNRNECSCII